MNDKVRYWFDMAEDDLRVAKMMLDGRRYLWMGFICHLVIEKGFKALISEGDKVPPKIHALRRLARIADVVDQLNDEQLRLMTTLDSMQIETRYPEYKSTIAAMLNKDEGLRLFSGTTELFSWIKAQIKT
ncbi:MAG: HEPN domain-containing protein [Thermoguttaceae bacterium]